MGLNIVGTAAVRRPGIIFSADAQTVGSQSRPGITAVDGRRVLHQVEVIVRAAIITAVVRRVTEYVVSAGDGDETRIGEQGMGVLSRGRLPVAESILGGVPEADVGVGRGALVEKVVITDQARLAVRGHVEVIAAQHPGDIVVDVVVARAALETKSVADRLIEIVVVYLGAAGAVDQDCLVGVGVDNIIGQDAAEPAKTTEPCVGPDADRIGVHLIADRLHGAEQVDAVRAVVVDAIIGDGHAVGGAEAVGQKALRIVVDNILRRSAGVASRFVVQVNARRVVENRVVGDEYIAAAADADADVIPDCVAADRNVVGSPLLVAYQYAVDIAEHFVSAYEPPGGLKRDPRVGRRVRAAVVVAAVADDTGIVVRDAHEDT